MEAEDANARACWSCGAVAPGLACPGCGAVQPVPAEADLFAVLGLPRRLALDPGELERRYHDASRAVHPDRYQTATARERELSLAASAVVNRAYRSLRDPVARGKYWLDLHGAPLANDSKAVPSEIAAQVFETQEKLAELRAARGTEADALRDGVRILRDGLAARLASLRDGLGTLYVGNGASASLDELRRRLAEIAYLRTLLGDVEDAIGEGLRGTDHRH